MFPLVRVGAAVSEDVVTSIKLFAIRYNITSLPARKGYSFQAFDHGGHTVASV